MTALEVAQMPLFMAAGFGIRVLHVSWQTWRIERRWALVRAAAE